jgi:arylsulfatase A-like enzyme
MMHCILKAVLGLSIVSGVAKAATEGRPTKPNVVILLVDDLGWQDVKCYDIDEPSPMETPNIDRLAKRGVLFRQGYAPAPTCAPTRAAILSGDHPARAQLTHVSGGVPPAPHHARGWAMMSPWYSARMPAETVTIAEALKASGYTTGHSGKWHVSKDHHGFPQPGDQGFDFTRSSRGVQVPMAPDRLTGFATDDPKDPFRLDENGIPFDQTHADAMTFVEASKDKPFFLYYAMWQVHSPWVMRSKALLDKYVKKLGVELTEDAKKAWRVPGQNNPFYCAMVEQMDYHAGQLFAYLEETEDPRWPGHKLIENTYVIFTSDNGGMEGAPEEVVTDNIPLDKGKISLKEGGTRVPLIIVGPGIPAGIDSDVMVSGLDFYPTILSLTGSEIPDGKTFDGLDLSKLLRKDPADPSLVREADGRIRDTMVWHFPNSSALMSTIRIGDYKLIRNYGEQHPDSDRPFLELYHLYDSTGGKPVRVDIEEAHNLAEQEPGRADALNRRLTEILSGMKASYPYWNPLHSRPLPHKEKVPAMVSCNQAGGNVVFDYRENGAKVVRADLIYTLNGGQRFEEWFRKEATLLPDAKGSVTLPEGTTHFFINLIDENNFLVSYPPVVDAANPSKDARLFAEKAMNVTQPEEARK